MQYPQKESATLEFKQEIPQKQQTMLKTVIGFANTYGGQIIIGVSDNREIVGIPETQIDQLVDDLNRAIYDSASPHIFPSIYTKRIGENLVVIIDIAEGGNKPYHFTAKSIKHGTYVRLGAHTMQATPEIVEQLQWQNQRKFLDEIPVYSASSEDINIAAFEKFLHDRKQSPIKVDVEEMLHHYEILTKDRGRVYPTVGGILLFGKQPEKFVPEAFIIASHISGTSGRNVIATRDCTGTLYQQYIDAVAFVTSRLNTSFTITGTAQRDEKLEVPPEALREIILNAIVHRNYQINGAVKISIFDDRIEIFSPGNFPGPIMAEKVDIGVTYIRNKIITKVFRDIGVIEKLGSGFITLFSKYREYKLPAPSVVEGVGFVKCILPRPSPTGKTESNDDYQSVSQLLQLQESVNTQEVARYLFVSRATASRLLAKLTQEGLLRKIGKGRGTRYLPASR